MMLAAVLLGALAFTGGPAGGSGGLWISDAAPRAGTDYVAISWSGGGEFGCGGSIGRQYVSTTAYRLTDPAVVVCVMRIPRDAAGKKLSIGFFVTFREGNLITHADGARVRPKLIRR